MSVVQIDPPTTAGEITFAAGIPGFPNDRRFRLESWGPDESPFATLVSNDNADVGFVVVEPWVFYPEYEFDLADDVAARLGLTDPADALVVCVVTLGAKPEDSTINLLGPIVVHRRTGAALQAVLEGAHDLRAPIARS